MSTIGINLSTFEQRREHYYDEVLQVLRIEKDVIGMLYCDESRSVFLYFEDEIFHAEYRPTNTSDKKFVVYNLGATIEDQQICMRAINSAIRHNENLLRIRELETRSSILEGNVLEILPPPIKEAFIDAWRQFFVILPT